MAGDTVITVVGNLTADPELKYTPSGAPVANFTIASTPRRFNSQTSQWEDGEALFLRCNIWRQPAEHVAESLKRGMRVIAQGRLRQRSFETREGEKRSVMELEVEEIGPSLRFATAAVERSQRGGQGGYGGGGNGGGYSQGSSQPSQGAPAPRQQAGRPSQGGYGGDFNAPAENDPWGSAPQAGSGFGSGDDDPPF